MIRIIDSIYNGVDINELCNYTRAIVTVDDIFTFLYLPCTEETSIPIHINDDIKYVLNIKNVEFRYGEYV